MADSQLFTIAFEGEDLPLPMCCVDLAALYDYLPGIPEETSEWMWAFTICLDRQRSAPGPEVLHHAGILRRQMDAHRGMLVDALIHSGRDPERVDTLVAGWGRGLGQICRLASEREVCRWRGNN